MRFSYAESMIEPSQYFTLAIEAEKAGFTSFTIPDSIVYPEHSDTKYPYYGDGDRTFLEDKPFVESFILIPALAAVTERLRFTTFVVKLPIRQPVLVRSRPRRSRRSRTTASASASACRPGPRTSPPPASRGRGAASAWTR